MSPVLIHIPSRTYVLVEPRRILTVISVERVDNEPVLSCSEIVWENSQRRDLTNVKIGISGGMRPIDEFYHLDPFDIDTGVYSWKEGVLSIAPLSAFPRTDPVTVKEKEELKRDRSYPPVQRWKHIEDFMAWIGHR